MNVTTYLNTLLNTLYIYSYPLLGVFSFYYLSFTFHCLSSTHGLHLHQPGAASHCSFQSEKRLLFLWLWGFCHRTLILILLKNVGWCSCGRKWVRAGLSQYLWCCSIVFYTSKPTTYPNLKKNSSPSKLWSQLDTKLHSQAWNVFWNQTSLPSLFSWDHSLYLSCWCTMSLGFWKKEFDAGSPSRKRGYHESSCEMDCYCFGQRSESLWITHSSCAYCELPRALWSYQQAPRLSGFALLLPDYTLKHYYAKEPELLHWIAG